MKLITKEASLIASLPRNGVPLHISTVIFYVLFYAFERFAGCVWTVQKNDNSSRNLGGRGELYALDQHWFSPRVE